MDSRWPRWSSKLTCLVVWSFASPHALGDEDLPPRLAVILIVDESIEGARVERAKIEKSFDSWYKRQCRNENPLNIRFSKVTTITFRYGKLTNGVAAADELLTPERLVTEVQRPILDDRTTLICYFIGHGVGRPDGPLLLFDKQRGAGDNSCRIGSRTLLTGLSREEIPGQPRPKMTVLITDCCAKAATVVDAGPTDFQAARDSSLFAELVASEAKGTMQISSATFDELDPASSEVAWAPENGTMFGAAFRRFLAMSAGDALQMLQAIKSDAAGSEGKDVNADSSSNVQVPLRWQDAFVLLRHQTDKNYQGYRERLWREPGNGQDLSAEDVNHLFRQTNQRPELLVSEIKN